MTRGGVQLITYFIAMGALGASALTAQPGGNLGNVSKIFLLICLVAIVALIIEFRIQRASKKMDTVTQIALAKSHHEKTCHEQANVLALNGNVSVDCGYCDFNESLGPATVAINITQAEKRHDEREVFGNDEGSSGSGSSRS